MKKSIVLIFMLASIGCGDNITNIYTSADSSVLDSNTTDSTDAYVPYAADVYDGGLSNCLSPIAGTYHYSYNTVMSNCGDLPSEDVIVGPKDDLTWLGMAGEVCTSYNGSKYYQDDINLSSNKCTCSITARCVNTMQVNNVINITSDQYGLKFTGTLDLSIIDLSQNGAPICNGAYTFTVIRTGP